MEEVAERFCFGRGAVGEERRWAHAVAVDSSRIEGRVGEDGTDAEVGGFVTLDGDQERGLGKHHGSP